MTFWLIPKVSLRDKRLSCRTFFDQNGINPHAALIPTTIYFIQIGKNLYQWHGVTHQLKTLAWLKQLAEKLNMLQRYHDVKQIEAAEESASDSLLYGSSPCNGQVRLTIKGIFMQNT